MDYQCIKNDIIIAEAALTNSKLDEAVYHLPLLCEVYCLTPFHWQTFYLRIFDGLQYTLQYAKPYLATHAGLESVSVTFADAVKAEQHIGCKGDIYCGLKLLPKSDSTISTLLQCLPSTNETEPEDMIMIDGVSTVIINHTQTPPVTLHYRESTRISKNHYTQNEAEFLSNLFIHIEKLIGNLRNQKR